MHGEHEPTLTPVKCLIVDDLEENLLALAALLRRDGVEVLQARSGLEALELLLVHDVALAFLDVQMPEMDGFELAELMRGSARTRDVPLIFVTAGAQDQRRVFKGYESGAVDFLFKPIEPHVLESKARVFFQLHRQKLQLARDLQARTETLRLNEIFTAVLGHDLRTPLSTLMMTAQLLQYRAQDDELRRIAGRLLSSGQYMSRMIGDLLDLSRARLGGGIALDRQRVDLGAVVQRVVQQRRDAEPGRRIDLVAEGGSADAAAAGASVAFTGQAWDADRLTQVVGNLIDNALRHGQRDEPIDVHLDGREGARVVLTVANAGTIPLAVRASIFEPFRGKPREGGQSEGLGLGLYIVEQIVQAHGGAVLLDAETPGRTAFRVSLPRDAGQAPAPAWMPVRPRSTTPELTMALQIVRPHDRDLGGGFVVRRLLPDAQRASVGPFVFFDHFGPITATPQDNHDVRPHPHIGLATVTYLFEGSMQHRDSTGAVQRIEPGAINWMTAGRGIVHSERTPDDLRAVTRRSHGLQLWAALPAEHEETAPRFEHTAAAQLPEIDLPGARARVLVGAAHGGRSPVATLSPTLYVDYSLAAGADVPLPVADAAAQDASGVGFERALYGIDSPYELAWGGEVQTIEPFTLALLPEGAELRLRADGPARVVLIGGQPLGKRHLWWNFVSSSADRIKQAADDWDADRFEAVPGETERMPLPARRPS